jgi:RimJ/RimL family protein N-acetyltransferase
LPIFRHGPTVRFTWFDWGDDFWNLGRLGARYESFARSALDGHRHDFFLRRREDGALIGRCALYPGVGPGSWEFGITLHEPYWGQRYAAETIEAIFRFVFVDLGGTEVRFRTEPENEKMLKQYERLAIPKVIDAADDVPEPPLFHRYHHFALGADAWRARGQ